MSPRKALDQSLLQQFQCMRQFPGKSITILDFVSSESESGSETKSGPESEPEESVLRKMIMLMMNNKYIITLSGNCKFENNLSAEEINSLKSLMRKKTL